MRIIYCLTWQSAEKTPLALHESGHVCNKLALGFFLQPHKAVTMDGEQFLRKADFN